jgi:gliding motility-associated-like protein
LANIFTPNGDGKNDFYHFKNILIDELINFQIFNRWGELVFETKSLSDQWDGSYKGRELPTDVYTYQIIGICYGARFEDSGNISLIR